MLWDLFGENSSSFVFHAIWGPGGECGLWSSDVSLPAGKFRGECRLWSFATSLSAARVGLTELP